MKKICLFSLTLLLLLFTQKNLKAQEKKNVIKLSPLSLIVLTGNVQYERILSNKLSLNLGLYYGGLELQLATENTSQKYKFSWAGITPELRYYLTGQGAPDGLYTAPYLRFRRMGIKWQQKEDDPFGDPYVSDVKLRFLSAGFGGMIGYQALLGEIVTLDTYLGVGYNFTEAKVIYNTAGTPLEILELVDFQGLALRPGFTIGIAF